MKQQYPTKETVISGTDAFGLPVKRGDRIAYCITDVKGLGSGTVIDIMPKTFLIEPDDEFISGWKQLMGPHRLRRNQNWCILPRDEHACAIKTSLVEEEPSLPAGYQPVMTPEVVSDMLHTAHHPSCEAYYNPYERNSPINWNR